MAWHDEKTHFLKLNAFLNELEEKMIFHRIEKHSTYAVMVLVDIPGERWEVEFMDDDGVQYEVFRSDGEIVSGQDAVLGLSEMIRTNDDPIGGDGGEA
jgi:hypothetical protein